MLSTRSVPSRDRAPPHPAEVRSCPSCCSC